MSLILERLDASVPCAACGDEAAFRVADGPGTGDALCPLHGGLYAREVAL